MITITAIVPTYRRPKDLSRCLEALKRQNRLADEVLVVVRDTDTDSWAFIKEYNPEPLKLRTVTVTVPGVVAALNAALKEAKGDIVTVTDDDAAPHSDWLERMEKYYLSDHLVGGVGGRDWVYWQNKLLDDGTSEVVGIVQWWGRAIGKHHIGVGKAREVDLLKGVNMSFRRQAIASIGFDERMRGTGAQVHFEMSLCLAVKRAGWKIIYDPEIAVDHFPAQRFDEDKRDRLNETAVINSVHNETVVLLEHLPLIRRIAFILWAMLIGTQEALGLIQLLRFLPSEGSFARQKWLASVRGRWQGWLTWQATQNQASTKTLLTVTSE
ncbi:MULTISPECIES: glycosyltransferase family 2 protein [Nostocales]|uniref:Glycosyl transferase family A n=3 Tax=Nostocales TaxID=1161 RepID=A0A0C1R1E4_9CYAN|nr:glycosyltransferase family 2 protein [Tolypothrix bouteillei]KAF3884506.1 glycosyltransferase family 2 protein [Tolypothrix bouteillei VB521301]